MKIAQALALSLAAAPVLSVSAFADHGYPHPGNGVFGVDAYAAFAALAVAGIAVFVSSRVKARAAAKGRK
jgi:hypothetical protein